MSERTAIIIGCSHPVITMVSSRLAARGDRVVVLGVDDTRLLNIAKASPERIETLSLTSHSATRLAHLREAWGNLPIHSYLDMSPFCTQGKPDATLALSSMSILSTFKAGLRAGSTKGLIVFRDAAETPSGEGPLDVLMARIATELAPARITGLRLRGYDSPEQHRVWTQDITQHVSADVTSPEARLGWNPDAA